MEIMDPPPPVFLNISFMKDHTSKNYNYCTFKKQSKKALYQEGISETIFMIIIGFRKLHNLN